VRIKVFVFFNPYQKETIFNIILENVEDYVNIKKEKKSEGNVTKKSQKKPKVVEIKVRLRLKCCWSK
jgi:hypothetical protein